MPDLIDVYGSGPATLNTVYAVNAFARIIVTLAYGSRVKPNFAHFYPRRSCFLSGDYIRMTRPFLIFFFTVATMGVTMVMFPLNYYVMYLLAFLMGGANAIFHIGKSTTCTVKLKKKPLYMMANIKYDCLRWKYRMSQDMERGERRPLPTPCSHG